MRMRMIAMTAVAMSTGLLLIGCATTGYQKAGRGTQSMEQMKAELESAFGQVTTAVTSLDAIMTASVGDLRPMYRQFGNELRTLERAAVSARRRAANMRSSNEAFFSSWAQRIESIQDRTIRASSLERFNSTRAEYQALERSLFVVGDAYAPVISGLTDIHRALGIDLTSSGVNAMRPSYNATRAQAIQLQNAIRQSITQIDALTTDLSNIAEMRR